MKKINISIVKKTNSKIRTIALAILLISSFAASAILLPSINAHSPPWQISTTMFVSVAPNPVGVGQTVTLLMWLNAVPPTSQGPQGDRWTFYYNITDPNGKVTSFGPVTSDDTGSGPSITYVPTIVGNYTYQAFYPGQTLAGNNPPINPAGVPYVGDIYEPSQSVPIKFTVQQAPVSGYPDTPLPLPTQYWQAPIESNNWAWSVLGGNWLADKCDPIGSSFNPYTTAPNTAHILWTKPFMLGGQAGGSVGNLQTQFSQDQYSPPFSPAIIIGGTLYYNQYTQGVSLPGIVGVNLRTGETLWVSNGSGVPVTLPLSLNQPGCLFDNNTFNRLTFGEVFQYVSPDQYGANPYLWAINGVNATAFSVNAVNSTGAAAPRYDMYDASSGAYMLSLTNAMACNAYAFDANGALCGYILGGGGTWLAFWNSSKVYGMLAGIYGNEFWGWRPMTGQNLDWRTGVQWNVSVPLYNQPFAESLTAVVGGAQPGGVVLASTVGPYGTVPQTFVMDIAYDAMTGNQLWAQNRTLGRPTMLYSTIWNAPTAAGNGLYCHFDITTETLYAYSLQTGNQVWSCNAFNDDSLNYYADIFTSGYGCIYVGGYSGNVYAINQTNGKLLWEWSTGSCGTSVPGSPNWPINVYSSRGVGWTLDDGKLYVSTGHAYNPPMFNGAQMYCLNASTGTLIYSLLGWWQQVAVAYGEMVAFNGYDNTIYAFGKGLTATTISAPDIAVSQGSALVIRGTVTDQSPGQTCLGIPAAGTPAISDDSMSAWMTYLYEQQTKPTNATGVPVTISVIDSNGNNRAIGTTFSDINGMYSLTWLPDIPGNFTVTASFQGTNSYYPSSAETSFHVSEPAATPTPQPIQQASMADLYLVPGIIGIIVAIIVVGAVIILALRKRP
jgi:hypothetical protein